MSGYEIAVSPVLETLCMYPKVDRDGYPEPLALLFCVRQPTPSHTLSLPYHVAKAGVSFDGQVHDGERHAPGPVHVLYSSPIQF